MKSYVRKNLTEICTYKSGKINEGLLDWLVNIIVKNNFDTKTGKYIGSDPNIRGASKKYDKAKQEIDDAIKELKAAMADFKTRYPDIEYPQILAKKIKELEDRQKQL